MELTRGKAKIAQIQKWWTSAVVMHTLLQIDNTAFNSFLIVYFTTSHNQKVIQISQSSTLAHSSMASSPKLWSPSSSLLRVACQSASFLASSAARTLLASLLLMFKNLE